MVELSSTHITSLSLQYFRNYQSLELICDVPFVILTGENGAGKTNILEALSLLSPGRGFRNVPSKEQLMAGDEAAQWVMRAQCRVGGQEHMIASASSATPREKRQVKIDGVDGTQQRLADLLEVLWFLPTMSHLFSESNSVQRKYFDRIVYGFDREHASRIYSYEHYMRERNKLLSFASPDPSWLASIEQKMAEGSVAIAYARRDMVERLNQALQQVEASFPRAQLTVSGDAETALASVQALDAEQYICEALLESRHQDAQAKRASIGAHKSCFHVRYVDKDRLAAHCSTGEQKALLLSLLLAQIHAQAEWSHRRPIVLLDEMVAHLDAQRREALFQVLQDAQVQCFATGTDAADFDAVPKDDALFYAVENGHIIH